MAFVITTDVFCDGDNCACWIWGTTGPKINHTAAVIEAERGGWRRILDSKDRKFKMYCPACVKIMRGIK